MESMQYLSATTGLCDECLRTVQAKVMSDGKSVYLVKTCPEHGTFTCLLEERLDYHLRKQHYEKPGTKTAVQTAMRRGCPHDCGLCPEHEQHTCIGLIEVTQACDLGCPVCFARSKAGGDFLPMETFERMLDFYMQAEGGRAEILQISGGEPSLHPEILDMIAMAKAKGLGYVMLNTNGLRIASDKAFARALSSFTPGFEVYMQFDSLREEPYRVLRGRNLLAEKMKALEHLRENHVPVTLVMTVAEGVNDGELGDLVHFALNTPPIRGLNIQPLTRFGRLPERKLMPLTVSGALRRIEEQTGKLLRMDDFVPLPCHPERVAVTFLYRKGKAFLPITRNKKIEKYIPYINNTFLFSINDALSGGKPTFGCCGAIDVLRDFAQVVPRGYLSWDHDRQVRYLNENTFRVTVSAFLDRHSFEQKAMQKECVHVITPDLKRIPFSAYNLLHRDAP